MKKILFTLTVFIALTTSTRAEGFLSDTQIWTRLGYNIGGTAPVGLPASIRALNKFAILPNLQIGVEVAKPLSKTWGIETGLRLENKAMEIDAEVKNYKMEITRGDQILAGMFTGNVTTFVDEWMITLPVLATLNISEKVQLKAGPYASLLLTHGFDGYAYDGYLRVDNPTGPKVELGSEIGKRGDYNFSDDMRRMQVGLEAAVDWHLASRVGAFAELNWGLTGVHHSDFNTIEQTLYPIFATIGFNYRLK